MDILSNNKPPRPCKPRVSDGSHEGVYSVGVLSTVLVSSHLILLCYLEWMLHDSTLITFTAFPLRFNVRYTWGGPKIPGIVKTNYLKYLYKFETLVPFEVLPLRLDAATPAPLPMLEILSKTFNENAVKGRWRFADGPWQHFRWRF